MNNAVFTIHSDVKRPFLVQNGNEPWIFKPWLHEYQQYREEKIILRIALKGCQRLSHWSAQIFWSGRTAKWSPYGEVECYVWGWYTVDMVMTSTMQLASHCLDKVAPWVLPQYRINSWSEDQMVASSNTIRHILGSEKNALQAHPQSTQQFHIQCNI